MTLSPSGRGSYQTSHCEKFDVFLGPIVSPSPQKRTHFLGGRAECRMRSRPQRDRGLRNARNDEKAKPKRKDRWMRGGCDRMNGKAKYLRDRNTCFICHNDERESGNGAETHGLGNGKPQGEAASKFLTVRNLKRAEGDFWMAAKVRPALPLTGTPA